MEKKTNKEDGRKRGRGAIHGRNAIRGEGACWICKIKRTAFGKGIGGYVAKRKRINRPRSSARNDAYSADVFERYYFRLNRWRGREGGLGRRHGEDAAVATCRSSTTRRSSTISTG